MYSLSQHTNSDAVPYRLRSDASTGKAAGAVIYCPDTGRFLYVKRSETGDAPNTWACLGGGVDRGETIMEAIKREFMEEAQVDTDTFVLYPFYRFDAPGFSYYNFIGVCDEEFEPTLNHEHTEFVWSATPPTPLHPNFEKALRDPRFRQVLDKARADYLDEDYAIQAYYVSPAQQMRADYYLAMEFPPKQVDDVTGIPVTAGPSYEAFQGWAKAKQQEYLKEHPDSSFLGKVKHMAFGKTKAQKKHAELKKEAAEIQKYLKVTEDGPTKDSLQERLDQINKQTAKPTDSLKNRALALRKLTKQWKELAAKESAILKKLRKKWFGAVKSPSVREALQKKADAIGEQMDAIGDKVSVLRGNS